MPSVITVPLKEAMEIEFQRNFVKQFQSNPDVIREDWEVNHSLKQIVDICQINDNTKVLDVGCGISSVLHFIKGDRFGIDPLADKYHKIYQYPSGIKVTNGSGEKIPFPDNYFDVVFSSNALDHCVSPKKTIDGIYRVLKSSGYFILSVEVFPNSNPRGFEHPHTFTKNYVRSLVGGKFRTVFEKGTEMKDISKRTVNGEEEYYLSDTSNPVEEITLLLRKNG